MLPELAAGTVADAQSIGIKSASVSLPDTVGSVDATMVAVCAESGVENAEHGPALIKAELAGRAENGG